MCRCTGGRRLTRLPGWEVTGGGEHSGVGTVNPALASTGQQMLVAAKPALQLHHSEHF